MDLRETPPRCATAGSASSGLQGMVHEQAAKIQRWKVATQMDLDAKSAQMKQWALLLEQANARVHDEQRRADKLGDKLAAQSDQLDRMKMELDRSTAHVGVVHAGLKEMGASVSLHQKVANDLRAVNRKAADDICELSRKVHLLNVSLDDNMNNQKEQKDQLERTISALKADLFSAVERLSKEAQICEQLRLDLNKANDKLDESSDKIKELEDTIDSKDRDLDILKDHHAKEAASLVQDIRRLQDDLEGRQKMADELLQSLELLKAEKADLEGRLAKETDARSVAEKEQGESKSMLDSVKDESLLLRTQVADLQHKLSCKEEEASAALEKQAALADDLAAQQSAMQAKLEEAEEATQRAKQENSQLLQRTTHQEAEINDLKKVDKDVKLLRVDYEKAISDVQTREQEIQKLRQIQVAKLDQDEDIRSIKKKHRECEEALAKSLEEAESMKGEIARSKKTTESLEADITSLQKQLETANEKSAMQEQKIAQLEDDVAKKEETLSNFRFEALDLAKDVENKYKKYLENAQQEKAKLAENLAEVKGQLEKKERELHTFKQKQQEKTGKETQKDKVEKEALSSNSKSRPARSAAKKTVTFSVFGDDEDSSSPDPVVDKTAPKNKAAGDSSYKIFTSRNKRTLESDDFDAFLASNKTKAYEPKRKRRPFFSKK